MNIIEYAKFKKMFGGTGGATVEGTAIPVGVQVDKIYFNTNLTKEETDAYLSQLTYIQTPLLQYPINPIFAYTEDGVSGIFILVVKVDNYYEIIAVSDISTAETFGLYSSFENEVVQHRRYEGIYGSYYSIGGVNCYDILHHLLINGVTSLTDFNGLPVGAENEKIKNVLSITPFTASTSSGATAYTVSSVDELPSDAVDGSLAIVQKVERGTVWVLNNELTPFEDTEEHSANFVVVGRTTDEGGNNIPQSTYMYYRTFGPPAYGLYWENHGYVYYYETNYGVTKGWIGEEYKTIAVISADDTVKTWLETNGTNTGEIVETSTTSKLYTRENGSWVYKGEVV